MKRPTPEYEDLLTPSEVARMFRVDTKTVTRWAKASKLTCVLTLGGHRRYREAEVRALLAGVPADTPAHTEPEPTTEPTTGLIVLLRCRDEILVPERLAPGEYYQCDRHGSQQAVKVRAAGSR